ncbi:hypothetical protein M452_0211445 [Staphylococcus epidermidis APO35]|nr:hypothetical protein M462_0204640 [Staphylococcus epidermidis CIM28]ESR21835.1 hypothetical protein M452_0211445 [Staphylococcus epidermidis APO35]ESV10193.1 hypothetical protein M456_0205265 [Staphylococcus epidermidis MC28]ESV14605.1 hypothetical protein M463_0206160 [Staphylococcus epidermidis WI05]ESV19367.1 hypothetical protein M464_0205795 [Staphylococcus epidermidis WI09]ESV24512.1 hypothetical protein M453_0206950 [Staphylococcus epidermidis CIM40]ESV28701.1 hypothetical protein M4
MLIIIITIKFYALRKRFQMSKENLNIDRINELARKKKEQGLTNEEAKEQTKLRKQYLEEFRKGFKQQIENTKVIDPEGNDVTPEKLKKIQKENHNK